MTKARVIAAYMVYNSNIADNTITAPKLSTNPNILEDRGSITDSSIIFVEDYGSVT